MANTSTSEIVTSERRGAVKWIRFNRPEVKNALGPDSANMVREEMAGCVDEGVRVVVLSGTGGSFCSGADLKALAPRMGEGGSVRDVLVQEYHPMIKTMVELPIPVIAAVDGAAAGIGSDIALAADLRLLSENAFFSEVFVNIGLIPDGGGTFHLPRLVGVARAMEMAMTARRVKAEEAVAWGLANEVYPAADFEEMVDVFAKNLAERAPLSLARSKKAIRASLEGGTLAKSLTLEADMQEELFATADFQEGVTAFLQKRKPNFQGK